MPFPKLDEICQKLLVSFLVAKKSFRFNQFYRFLNSKGVKISKPTLVLHLQHLIDVKLVERTVIDKQNITYNINRKFSEGLTKYVENQAKILEHFEKERKSFDSDTPLAQLSHAHIVLVLQGLYRLKYEMLKIAEPDKEFEHNMEIMLYSDIWQNFVGWLLQNFNTGNKNYRKDILDTIEGLITKYIDVAFTPNKTIAS